MTDVGVSGRTGSAAQVRIARHSLAAVVDAPGRRVVLAARCGACGAGVKKKVFALCCRSCGAFLGQDSDLTERARPDGLVPFAIDEAAARAAFAEWATSRRFAPRALADRDRRVRELDAVFLPLWSFDVNTVTDYFGERGERRIRYASGRARAATEWHKVRGRVSRRFDAVMVPGCSALVAKLPYWPFDGLVPYRQGASRGRRVIAYDVEPEYGFEQAKAIMGRRIEGDVRAGIGGYSQRARGVNTTYLDPGYSLYLLPAWLLTYVHNGRTWSALINGSTGKVVGDRPYSVAKILTCIATLAAGAAAVDSALALLHH